MRRLLFLPFVALGLAASGCQREAPPAAAKTAPAPGEPVSIALQTVDVPEDKPVVRAMIELGKVELVPAKGGAPVVLAESAGSHDLVLLTSAMPAAKGEVPPGCYSQIALYFRSATLTLDPSAHFQDGKLTRQVVDRAGPPVRVEASLAAAGEGASACEGGVQLGRGANLNLQFEYDRSIRADREGAEVKDLHFTPSFTAKLGPEPGAV